MTYRDEFKKIDDYFNDLVDKHTSRYKLLSIAQNHFKDIRIYNLMCAEIGVFRGEFSKKIIEYLNPKHMNLIDIWKSYRDHTQLCKQSDEYFDYVYSYICDTFNNDRYSVIKNASIEASKQFADNSLDFIYIDANHDDCLNDLIHWYPKLKSNGIIAGHDYYDNVKKDVDKFFYNQHKVVNSNIPQWYFIKI